MATTTSKSTKKIQKSLSIAFLISIFIIHIHTPQYSSCERTHIIPTVNLFEGHDLQHALYYLYKRVSLFLFPVNKTLKFKWFLVMRNLTQQIPIIVYQLNLIHHGLFVIHYFKCDCLNAFVLCHLLPTV